MTRYTFQRVDTATRIRRDELLAMVPTWGEIDINRPQFAIFDGDRPDNMQLYETSFEAANVCQDLNALLRAGFKVEV